MNEQYHSHEKRQGFTLLELIIVMALISMVMFFTLPNFDDGVSFNKTDQFSRWLTMNVLALRDQAEQEKRLYALAIDLSQRTIAKLDESALTEGDGLLADDASPKMYPIPNGIRILDVEFPRQGKISFGQALIYFYSQGYSDKALIHVEDEDGRPITFLIEPFLSKVKRFDHYAGFED